MGAGQPGTRRDARIFVWAAEVDIMHGLSASAAMRGVSKRFPMRMHSSLTPTRIVQLRRCLYTTPGNVDI